MQRIKISKLTGIQIFLVAAAAVFLFLAAYSRQLSLGQNFLQVFVDDEPVGAIAAGVDVEAIFMQARRELAAESGERICLAYDWRSAPADTLFTPLMTERELLDAVKRF